MAKLGSTLTRCRLALVLAAACLSVSQPLHAAADDDWKDERQQVIRRAQIWHPPPTPIASARLDLSPRGPGAFAPGAAVECRFNPKPADGATAKFDCLLPDGVSVKVKYGADNGEIYAEVIGTRLLAALGFWADRMYPVAAVRCAGCPGDPFAALECVHHKDDVGKCLGAIDYTRVTEFPHAVIERPVAGRRIEHGDSRGWAWDELNAVDASAGGATAAQIGALRLLAVFLNHWDSKDENQRLLCLDAADSDHRCDRPVMMIQDLGASFGPKKMDVDAWASTPIWADEASCLLSMDAIETRRSTFPDVRIGEASRRFLADRLGALSPEQVRGLFTGAHVERFTTPQAASRDIERWVSAFTDKVRAVVQRPACPN